MPRLLSSLSLAIGLLSFAPTHAAARGQVLSLSGRAIADGAPLAPGDSLDGKKQLDLRSGTRLEALLGEGLHLALVGTARVELDTKALRVHAARVLEVSATSGTISLPNGHRAVVSEPGATLRYREGALQILWGELTLERICPEATTPSSAPSGLAATQPSRCEPREKLRKGDHVLLAGGSLQPAPIRARKLSRYPPPPRWMPTLAITLADLESVQQWVAAKRKSQQELAACGCTEGASGGTAGTNPQQGSISPIENNAATLWISVKGLPPRATP